LGDSIKVRPPETPAAWAAGTAITRKAAKSDAPIFCPEFAIALSVLVFSVDVKVTFIILMTLHQTGQKASKTS
jgi:hypothetical protein